jgi:hypothetical protein
MTLTSLVKALRIGGEIWFTLEKTVESSLPSGEVDRRYGVTKFHYSRDQVGAIIDLLGVDLIEISEQLGYKSQHYSVPIEYFYVRARKKCL